MIQLALISILPLSLDSVEPIPIDLLHSYGFELYKRISPPFDREQRERILFRRAADGTSLHIGVRGLPSLKESITPFTDIEQHDNMALWLFKPDSPSGVDLGSHSLWYYKKGFMRTKIVGRYERVDAQMRMGADVIKSGAVDLSDPNRREDAKKFEVVMRHALARLALRRLSPTSALTINGKSIAQLRDGATGRKFVRLDSWASAKGWGYRWNSLTAMAALTKGSRTVLIPLAARSIKVDGSWKDTGEIIVMKDSGLFVNAASLP